MSSRKVHTGIIANNKLGYNVHFYGVTHLCLSSFLSGMSNCRFFQCNLDYFCGDFDIGVSLHACGLATDLVLAKCLSADSASFVCCPCCYGGIRENRVVAYPKSAVFKNLGLSFKVIIMLNGYLRES